MIYVMNHYTRDCSEIVSVIESQGFTPKVITDHTDFYKARDETRYDGLNGNYQAILEDSVGLEWRIVFHDDVEIGPIQSMLHVLKYAPPAGVSFYTPQNKGYFAAAEAGHHVVKTNNNIWLPAMAFHDSYVREYLVWLKIGTMPPKPVAEDTLLKTWSLKHSRPLYAIIPSLSQHAGYADSTFKNPAKIGRYYRYSNTYNPSFDVTQVDWKKEFESPYVSNMPFKGAR